MNTSKAARWKTDPKALSKALFAIGIAGVILAPQRAAAQASAEQSRPPRIAEVPAALSAEARAESVAALLHDLQGGLLMPRARVATIAELGKLGPAAAPAIAALESELTNPMAEVASGAFKALGAIRNEPPLDRAALLRGGTRLADASEILRGRNSFRAFQGLRALPGEEALKLLRDALKNDVPLAQQVMALEEIARLDPADPDTIGAVLPSLASPHGLIMSNAVAALARAPMDDAGVREALAGALSWHSDQAAVETAKLLARSAPAAAACVPKVIAALKQGTGRTDFRRLGAYMLLLRVAGREASAPAVPVLVGFLSETAPIYQGRDPFFAKSVRRYVLITLADLGAPPEAIPVIIDEMTNALESATIAAAARAAGAVTSGQEKVVPHLKRALARRGLDSGVRLDTIEVKTMPPPPLDTSPYLEIIRALTRLGAPAKSALPELAVRARDPVRRSAQFPPYQQAAARAAIELSK